MTGHLLGIARREKSRAPMEELSEATVSLEAGIAGDSKGLKFPKRQVTLIERGLWHDTVSSLGVPGLPWTARRANLLVEGVTLPRGRGSVIRIGDVLLEVTAETTPCARMDEICPGLRRALATGGRGGVTTRVIAPGRIALGDEVTVISEQPSLKVHLPG